MKKQLSFIMSILVLFAPICATKKSAEAVVDDRPKLAIVIDDFGEDRRGVEEMLAIGCPLTIAVMPAMEYSLADSEKAHQLGYEVILHMPMENSVYTPDNYYGPMRIYNDTDTVRGVETLEKALSTIKYATGVNIHMGTGVSKNKVMMTALMNELKQKGLYFLDSKTTMGSVCDEVATSVGINYYSRDVFLEPSGSPNYDIAIRELNRAVSIAKEKGKCVAIGHVGPVGSNITAKAIKDMVQTIKDEGVELVLLSKL